MNYGKNYLAASSAADRIREQAVNSEKPRRGLAARTAEMFDQSDAINSAQDMQLRYMQQVRQMFEEDPVQTEEIVEEGMIGLEKKYTEGGQLRPQGRSDVVPEKIKSDPEFMSEVKRLSSKYGFPESELFRLIQGESSFNPRAKNKSGATGLLQFMPDTLAELGFTTNDVINMAPAEQLKVYDKYLERWNYNGQVPLAVMHASPAYAGKPMSHVAYKKGSKAWEQNPGWRPADGGDITLASITEYYRGK